MEPQTLEVIVTQICVDEDYVKVKLRVSASKTVTLRAYWGIDISAFFHVLR